MPIAFTKNKLNALPVEELANTLTHGFGLLLSVCGFAILLTLSILNGGALLIASAVIYGASLIALYAASTFYHGATSPEIKTKLQLLDHCCIFLLIAGTNTPFALIPLRGNLGTTLFILIWTFAIVGIIAKTLLHDRVKAASVAAYLVMGWIGVIAVKPLYETLGLFPILLVIAGGLVYTLGTIFYGWHSIKHHHAIWHLFVLGGSLCHFLAIVFYVFPYAQNL